MAELVFRANGDYRCSKCKGTILFEDTFLTNKCPDCGECFSIPNEASYMYDDVVMHDGILKDIKDLPEKEKMYWFMAYRAYKAKKAIPIINLDRIRSVT